MFDVEVCTLANDIMDMIDAGRLGGYEVDQMIDLVAGDRCLGFRSRLADYLQDEFGIV